MVKLSVDKLCLILVLVAPLRTATARDKTDVLSMKNGDRITCEIVSLSRGQLLIKTDYATGTVIIDWSEIDSIVSPQEFIVDAADGERLTGEIRKVPEMLGKPGTFVVANRQFEPAGVVGLTQAVRGPLSSWVGSVSGGLSVASGNQETQYTASAHAAYYGRVHQFKVEAASTLTSLSGTTAKSRHSLTASHVRFLPRNWLIGESVDLLRSDEQQLDLRTVAGGFGGRQLLRSNASLAQIYGGAVFTNEIFRSEAGTDSRRNIEALVGARLQLWRFDSTEFNSELRVYPNLTTLGQIRTDLNSYFKLDIIGNLFVRMNFFGNYQSAPPQNAPKFDLGLSTTMGWSF